MVLASLSNKRSKDQKTSNSIANGINITYLLLWIEMKRSENYFFFTATLSKNLEIAANIVPHQGKFKKFILNNKEIELEGT
ncbi:hypothetical protein [Spiroplasma citri]|uniref:Uncharacterized protein n=1 Tax=Spiroplasma citri TaxID=2133 RepID=Q14P81_SPICI|nr:hypothetical protein [Spiroplasma citri]APE74373.1 hypothetical protein SCITRI_00468 [Spiroplasma citri]WFG98831.1 hypothetical protein M1770_02355 [Spiroplasma citri]CAK98698.1 hypothetical protein SPICI03_233 [Spiroplasma citri]